MWPAYYRVNLGCASLSFRLSVTFFAICLRLICWYFHNVQENPVLDGENETCGICMDTIIDRGVLDCCQHWYAFKSVFEN